MIKFQLITLCLLLSTISIVKAAEVWNRHRYDGHHVWSAIDDCVSKYFNGKAAIDRLSHNINGSYAIWLDSGNNVENDVDEAISEQISECIQQQYQNVSVYVFSHNSYAIVSSYDDYHEIKEHYDWFSRGYPEEYDPFHPESDTEGSDVPSLEPELHVRGGKVPDNLGDPMYYRPLIELIWYRVRDAVNRILGRQGYECGTCYSIEGPIPKSFEYYNDAGYEVDLMWWPHHECRSRSPDGTRKQTGQKLKMKSRHTNKENRTFMGITNDKLEVKGNLKLPVEINNRKFYETFIITPTSENEAIIGWTLLKNWEI
ncbi:hypothetical protein SPOG_04215 [Schizosaccharomyces cryophilus OY26]|uniref:Uncharacterized protein n=1 Tax=Schizosaccharomyces cryophilus (strain OY26 / ATCC MYA-4695 / CBS 11777 / NBRC 106824 / NRRL Y48691) TaxID=653667 RepID=S9W789_SCHCR|nr:uncharacterized protein SPOG_04215 [Schizosaccharomyces cryophilus OY26]EPY54324.1 hypothetical protein SPOG_04215 [Schizosaccharomyces cryophilus OY26]